jgi:hypothetical protein
MEQPIYDLAWVLPFVREALKGVGNCDFEQFVMAVMQQLAKANVSSVRATSHPQSTRLPFNTNDLPHDMKIAITEAFYYCEQNRFLLFQRDNVLNFGPCGRWTKTKRGEEWAKDVTPLPEDAAGYLRQFPPGTDAVVLEYITEALHTFINRNYFATAVMIGAASEATIYLLADALVPCLADAKKRTELTSRIDSRSLNKLLEYIERIVADGHKRQKGQSIIPNDVMGGTERHLVSLFDHIRLQRNDAVHPRNFSVKPDYVRAALSTFPLAFQKVDALRKWCGKHPNALL